MRKEMEKEETSHEVPAFYDYGNVVELKRLNHIVQLIPGCNLSI